MNTKSLLTLGKLKYILSTIIFYFGFSSMVQASDWRELPTTGDAVTLYQLPYWTSSSPTTSLYLTENGKLLAFGENGLYWRDMTAPDQSIEAWQRFNNFDNYFAANGAYYSGFGSAVSDPANPDVVYACGGSATSSVDPNEKTALMYGSVYRSTDALNTLKLIAHTDDNEQHYVLGCPSGSYARDYPEVETGIEMYIIASRNPHFAFDDRETVTVDGAQLSRTFYFMTFDAGLYRGSYSSDGILSWEALHHAPGDYLENGNGSTSQDPPYDFRFYQYAPLDGSAPDDLYYDASTDESGNPICNYEIDGSPVVGNYDAASGKCIEDEQYHIGSVVLKDPIHHQWAKANDKSNHTILIAGYMTQDMWPHGGLYYGVAGEDGEFVWTELKHPLTGKKLDVIDVDFDEKTSITLNSGVNVAKFFYVAAGRSSGILRGEVASDGTVNLTDISGELVTRDEYIACYLEGDCTADGISISSSSNNSNYQYVNVDHAWIDGTPWILAIGHGTLGEYLVEETYSDVLDWKNLKAGNSYLGGLIDEARKLIIVGTGESPTAVAFDSAKVLDTNDKNEVPWQKYNLGFVDRGGKALYDPREPDSRIHLTSLDTTLASVRWDKDYNLLEKIEGGNDDDVHDDDTSTNWRSTERGLCHGLYFVENPSDASVWPTQSDSPGHLETTASEMIDEDGSGDVYDRIRTNSYCNAALSGKTTAGENVVYVSSNYSSGKDGALFRGVWDEEFGDYRFTPAMGEKNCRSIYLSWDASPCYWLCDKEDSESNGALPVMRLQSLAVDPQDVNHLVLLGYDSKHRIFESKDGGTSWTEHAGWLESEDGDTVKSLASVVSRDASANALAIDPTSSSILYLVMHTKGIYKIDTTKIHYEDISYVATDKVPDPDTVLVDAVTATSNIRDIEAVRDSETGKTRLYITAMPFCSTWAYVGKYPLTFCTAPEGGGIYSILLGKETLWKKLNAASSEFQFFSAEDLAISPADPKTLVAVGSNNFLGWANGKVPENISAGIIYSRDSGTTWQSPSNGKLNASYVTPHPTDPDRYAIRIFYGGMWELNLNNPDADGDSIHDDHDTDRDGDGIPNDTDPAPDDPAKDTDGDGTDDESDCNPSDAAVHPGAVEVCNNIDDDCDAATDEDLPKISHYRDADRDKLGDPKNLKQDCLIKPPLGYVNNKKDCNDADKTILDGTTYYQDFDRDSYGNTLKPKKLCSPMAGYVVSGNDCNDADRLINPGMTERKGDGIDSNCNGNVDD